MRLKMAGEAEKPKKPFLWSAGGVLHIHTLLIQKSFHLFFSIQYSSNPEVNCFSKMDH